MASVKKNFSLNLIYQILNILVGLITTPYIARVLGATNSGRYSVSEAVARYFLLFIMLGISHYGNRNIAFARNDRYERSKTFSEIYALQLFMSVVVLLFYILYIMTICEDKLLAIIQGLFLFSGALDVSWLYFGMEKFTITVSRNIMIKAILTVGVFAFVHKETDVYLYTFIMASSYLVSNLVLVIPCRRYVDVRIPKLSDVKPRIKPILVLFVPVVAISIYNIMDKIMLGIMSDKASVGYYDYSEKIMQVPNAFIIAFSTVMLPRMSHLLKEKSQSEVIGYINRSMKFVSYFSVGMAFGLFAISDVLIPLFLGKGYTACIALVQILAPIILIKACANVVRTQFLIPYCRDNIYVVSHLLGAATNLVANLLLIPRLGAAGASIGTVIAEFFVMFYQFYKSRKDLPIPLYIKDVLKYIIFGLLMLVIIRIWVSVMNFNSIIMLVTSVVIGGLVYLVCGIIFCNILNDLR